MRRLHAVVHAGRVARILPSLRTSEGQDVPVPVPLTTQVPDGIFELVLASLTNSPALTWGLRLVCRLCNKSST